MNKYHSVALAVLIIFNSCEEVINIDLNSSDPALVVEAVICKDSVSLVRLTRTTSYFSPEGPEFFEDAVIKISDGSSEEELNYRADGYYIGNSIVGTEERAYRIEISHDGIIYKGISYLPPKTEILSLSYTKDESQTVFNPYGKRIFFIYCEFIDDPDRDNFYMIRYILDGEVLKGSYYLVTENNAINGYINNSDINSADNDTITFNEWMYYEGGEVEVQVFSVDESVYKYFLQLNDILYWKRRVMPPSPYNPSSNINNGALGYFAAWAYDSETIIVE
jgi:hypothetical protein